MGKIQTEVVSMLQTGVKAGSSYRTSGTDATFDKLLKEQNQAADGQTKKTAVSGKESPKEAAKAGKEELKPAKESGQKEKPEDTENSVEAGGVIPSELLLLLQEAAEGLAAAPVAEAADVSAEQTVVSGQMGDVLEVAVELPPELLTTEEESNGLPVQPEVSELQQAVEEATDQKAQTVQTDQAVQTDQMVQTVQTAEPEAKQAVQPEQAVSGPEEKRPAREAQRQPEFPESTEPVADQRSERTEASAKAFESQTRENAEPGQQQLVGMTGQPLREFTVFEPEQAASETVRTSEATLVNDVGRTIAQRLPAGDGTLTIELEPASLGKMTIHVLYESGKATVSILATNPRTLELLNARAGELASIIEERTGQDTVVYTEQPEQEQPFDERQREGQHRDREQESREHKERTDQDSFLQQLRLGVI